MAEAHANVFRPAAENKLPVAALNPKMAEDRAVRILESITDAFLSLDRDWQFTYVNPQAEKVLDRRAAELIGKVMWDEYRGLVGTEFERSYRETAAQQKPHSLTAFYPDHQRWYEVHSYPAADGGIAIYFRDVTQQKQVEAERTRLIEESDRQRRVFETALSNTADFNYVFNLEGRFTYVNAALLALWRKTLSEAIGRNFFELDYPPELAARLQDQIQQVIATQQPLRDETPYTSAIGTRAYEYIFVPVFGVDGSVEAVTGSTRDITERKLAEAAARKTDARIRNLADSAPVLIWETDEQGVSFVNRHYLTFFGRPFTELRGMGWATWIHPDDATSYLQTYHSAIARRERFESQARFLRHDGQYRWLLTGGSPHLTADGEFLGYLGSSSDVTDLKRAEETQRRLAAELSRVDQQKDEFLALLAHELRNPLAPLQNALQIIGLENSDPEAAAEARQVMERQLGHMVHLVDDLLDVSRLTTNKLELRRTRVSLTDIVHTAVETARPVIMAAGHQLSVAPLAEPVFLNADLTRMAQVFSNLLLNSAKYTARGGHISVNTTISAQQVSVAVTDNGIGIPAHALTSIFDMFSQVDRSMERSTGGLGIGLALVKGLVEMHDGAVHAFSEGSSKGSTFTVTLPRLLEAEGTRPQMSASASSSRPRRRILVVDDNRDSALSMASLLKIRGNDVALAHDGHEAVAAAAQFRPQIILMDVGMPELNGYDATRQIRAADWGREIVIIALTGWGQDSDRADSQAAGCNGHLVKPVRLAELEALLVKLLSPTRETSQPDSK
jgi:PAS domain S-box-containing protein